MITRAVTASRSVLHFIKKMRKRSIPQTFTEKIISQKSNRNSSTGFQPQTQTTSVTLNPDLKKTEITESISLTKATVFSIPTNFALILGFTIPRRVTIKTIRSNSNFYREPNTSENFTSQEKSSIITSHQFHNFQNTANIPFSQFDRSQKNIPMYKPFNDYNNQIQKNQTVANHQSRSSDQILALNIDTTTVASIS